MAILLTVHAEETPGPAIPIQCPKCGVETAMGFSRERVETLRLLGLIPLLKLRNTFVDCGECEAKLRSRLGIEELAKYQGAPISQFLSYDVSFVFKFLAITSLILSLVPMVGLGLAVLTLLGTFRTRGWPRTLGIVSLIVSAIVSGGFAFILLTAH